MPAAANLLGPLGWQAGQQLCDQFSLSDQLVRVAVALGGLPETAAGKWPLPYPQLSVYLWNPLSLQPLQSPQLVSVQGLWQVLAAFSMFTARKKIAKEKGAEPDHFEESVAQVQPFCILRPPSASIKSSQTAAADSAKHSQ